MTPFIYEIPGTATSSIAIRSGGTTMGIHIKAECVINIERTHGESSSTSTTIPTRFPGMLTFFIKVILICNITTIIRTAITTCTAISSFSTDTCTGSSTAGSSITP